MEPNMEVFTEVQPGALITVKVETLVSNGPFDKLPNTALHCTVCFYKRNHLIAEVL